jgi:hypothetical protein
MNTIPRQITRGAMFLALRIKKSAIGNSPADMRCSLAPCGWCRFVRRGRPTDATWRSDEINRTIAEQRIPPAGFAARQLLPACRPLVSA